MAAHYGVAVIPARAYKPRDKAKAESGVLIAERWIIARLRHRRFCSLCEANAAIGECVAEVSTRPFKKLDGRGRACSSRWSGPRCGRCPPAGMNSRPAARPG